MICNFTQFINEGAKRVPNNLLNTPMLFKNLDEILKMIPKKDKSTIDLEVYNEFIDYVTKQKSASFSYEQHPTLLYCFLEAWDYLKNIKLDYDLCVEMYEDINSNARFYRGSARDYAKKQEDFKYTINLCKTSVEYFYALYKYCKDLSMTYPMHFKIVVAKNFGDNIVNKIEIAANAAYMIEIDGLSKQILNY